jgi:hypothetical protein
MLVIWQGYGYVALAAAILPLVACVGLIDFSNKFGFLGFGLGMIVAGLICLGANRSFKRAAARRAAEAAAERDPENALRAGGSADGETVHTLYFVPLWVWGWVYCLVGVVFGGISLVGIILKGWKN